MLGCLYILSLLMVIVPWESTAITNKRPTIKNGEQLGSVRYFRHIAAGPPTGQLTDWETGLRESIHQALLRVGYWEPNLRERLINAQLIGRQDQATPFGDVAVLARGQLYAIQAGNFILLQDPYQNDCDDCYNPRRCERHDCQPYTPHNREILVALWTVKRLRHRDVDQTRFELEYIVSPVNSDNDQIIMRRGRFNYAIPGHVFVIRNSNNHNRNYPEIYNRKIPQNNFKPEVPLGIDSEGYKQVLYSYPGFYTSVPAHYIPPAETNYTQEAELYKKLLEVLASKTSTTQKQDVPHRFSFNRYDETTESILNTQEQIPITPTLPTIPITPVTAVQEENAIPTMKTTITYFMPTGDEIFMPQTEIPTTSLPSTTQKVIVTTKTVPPTKKYYTTQKPKITKFTTRITKKPVKSTTMQYKPAVNTRPSTSNIIPSSSNVIPSTSSNDILVKPTYPIPTLSMTSQVTTTKLIPITTSKPIYQKTNSFTTTKTYPRNKTPSAFTTKSTKPTTLPTEKITSTMTKSTKPATLPTEKITSTMTTETTPTEKITSTVTTETTSQTTSSTESTTSAASTEYDVPTKMVIPSTEVITLTTTEIPVVSELSTKTEATTMKSTTKYTTETLRQTFEETTTIPTTTTTAQERTTMTTFANEPTTTKEPTTSTVAQTETERHTTEEMQTFNEIISTTSQITTEMPSSTTEISKTPYVTETTEPTLNSEETTVASTTSEATTQTPTSTLTTTQSSTIFTTFSTKKPTNSHKTTTASDFLTESEPYNGPLYVGSVKNDYSLDDIFGTTSTAKPTSVATESHTESDISQQLFGGNLPQNSKVIFSDFYEASTSANGEGNDGNKILTSQSYETEVNFEINKRNQREFTDVLTSTKRIPTKPMNKKRSNIRYRKKSLNNLTKSTIKIPTTTSSNEILSTSIRDGLTSVIMIDPTLDTHVSTFLNKTSKNKQIEVFTKTPNLNILKTTKETPTKVMVKQMPSNASEYIIYKAEYPNESTEKQNTKEVLDDLTLRLVNHARSLEYLNQPNKTMKVVKYRRRKVYVPRSRRPIRKERVQDEKKT